jgi:FAD/FMN-containing dehydrogenase
MILVFEIKGAIQRVSKDAMAFEHRDRNFEMSIIGNWTEAAGDAANIQWARDVWTAAQPFVSSAVYANHMAGDEAPDRIQKAYGPEKYAKLAALKRTYDPGNFFRMNQNISPGEV